MFALMDCNNFYASCERLFRPDLREQAIVVLSNNDGCVIARSEEAKALGVPMGVPFFTIKALVQRYGIHVFSSNYRLYGDLSQRVMSVIQAAWPAVAVYSIDEAFLDLRTMPPAQQESFCMRLQKLIFKSTGIPTSFGLGPTKTLAKMASHICKKKLHTPVFTLTEHAHDWLGQITVAEVWGIGRQWQKKLKEQGIATAWDLAQSNASLIKTRYNVMLMRTLLELQGISCFSWEETQMKRSLISSKSFAQRQTEYDSLAQALSSHCARVSEKLRKQQVLAQRISVFVSRHPSHQTAESCVQSMDCRLLSPSDDTRLITKAAKSCLTKLYQPGMAYKKVGVMLGDFIPASSLQLDLFDQPHGEAWSKKERLMSLIDQINHRFGRHSIKLAAEGYDTSWAMRSAMRSPCYTTSWSDLAVVQNRT
ncbi:MAG: Y-family DNA polymerase [Legionellaceae bacterium]|nr:Y-family DNA polymerase [Legionellaceae bacterium]